MLTPTIARLANLPHDPLIEPRAWRLTCGAPCGCREPIGEVRTFDADAHTGWFIWLPDRYQPKEPALWVRGRTPRRPKLQPWASRIGRTGITPGDAVSDMRSRNADGRLQQAGHLIGPLGIPPTPDDIVIVCPMSPVGHHNHLTVAHVEREVARLREPIALD
ncbi:MAG: hypothetical protein ACXVCX_03495 [Ktedonobacterales bacterium]